MSNNSEKKTILLTGAGGYMARAFAEQFHNKYNIVGLHKKYKLKNKIFIDNVKYDLSKKKDIEIKEPIDIVLHYACLTDVKRCEEEKEQAFLTNTFGTLQLLELAKNKGIRKFILISTGSVFKSKDEPNKTSDQKEPTNFYALSKLLAEKLCNYYSRYFKVIVVRPFFPYGPKTNPERVINNLINNINSEKPVLLNMDNKPKINPCYIEDFNNAIASLIEKEDRKYSEFNIGGPQTADIKEISEIIGGLLGKKPIFRDTDKKAFNVLSDNSEINKVYVCKFDIKNGIKKTMGERINDNI